MLAATRLKVELESGNTRVVFRPAKLKRPDATEPVNLGADRMWQPVRTFRMCAQGVPNHGVISDSRVGENDRAPKVEIVWAHQNGHVCVGARGLLDAIPDDATFGGIGQVVKPRRNQTEERTVGCVSEKLVEGHAINRDNQMRLWTVFRRQQFGLNLIEQGRQRKVFATPLLTEANKPRNTKTVYQKRSHVAKEGCPRRGKPSDVTESTDLANQKTSNDEAAILRKNHVVWQCSLNRRQQSRSPRRHLGLPSH